MPSIIPNRSKGSDRPLATRILIADDAASSRELLRSILERSGYEIVEASDGEEVLRKAQDFQPDLLILDLQMPKLNGYSAVVALRKMPAFAKVPVMALAASLPDVVPEQMSQAGFTRWIVKPIRPARLRESVAQLLRGARAGTNSSLATGGARG